MRFDPRQRKAILRLVSASRPALGPAQTPVQWAPGDPFPGGKALPGLDADHSRHLVPGSRMNRSYTPLPLVVCMAVVGQLYFYS
jgi:hypothetical protein